MHYRNTTGQSSLQFFKAALSKYYPSNVFFQGSDLPLKLFFLILKF